MVTKIPQTYQHALEILNSDKYKIMAGGTDLMVQRRNWANTLPTFEENVIFVANLKELQCVNKIDDCLCIGGTATLTDIQNNEFTPKLLVDAIDVMASYGIRNIGTLAGNIANASPAGDSLPILYIYNTKISVESTHGVREIPIHKFILGPRKINLEFNEIIKEIQLPLLDFTYTEFVKVGGRKADAISKVSFAGAVNVVNDKVVDMRLSFGAVGPTVIRMPKVEEHFIGKEVSYVVENIDKYVALYEPYIKPIDDQRSNKEYRKKVALNMLENFLRNIK